MKRISNDEIAAMPASERLELMERLWDSFTDAEIPVHPQVRQELERRLETYAEDRKTARPWNEVRDQLLRGPDGAR